MIRSPDQRAPFRLVGDLEIPIEKTRQFVKAIAFLSEQMDDDMGACVQAMACEALTQIDAMEELRRLLWRRTHPDQEHLEKEGSQS